MQSKGTRCAPERCGPPGGYRYAKGYNETGVNRVPSRSQRSSGLGSNERERHLRTLADKLLFTVEKHGRRFTLSRTADVSRPVRREGLSLDKAEELLTTWKLRGLQGG
jgi:hypothetical protein